MHGSGIPVPCFHAEVSASRGFTPRCSGAGFQPAFFSLIPACEITANSPRASIEMAGWNPVPLPGHRFGASQLLRR